ncbi:DSBA oxidoreductase [Eremomyces bilateralis CBS 781.70]|uniref:DSBA oxidoreductase n=1 Tax=Eremomyces bilateralis CBS 781.70 TaxID=1392243 RepID=A0A6G1FUU3_9PEZI|nr:DSBA oxidoreductase [Eremomyces bilateralis CBS 781.70]KAF1809421.1 DSBA oxidoreductase [Eremomyces bilateralis CBS 781.70]
MTQFNIQVVSDNVCPWCYMGKKRLDKAIQQYTSKYPDSQDTWNITWKPFYLNPHAPKASVDKAEYYQSKFGPERTRGIFANLSQLGLSEGIHYKFGGRTGNTRDSHRLVQLGRERGLGTRVIEELFKGYFENEQDITSHGFLQTAGEAAGLDAAEVRDWLGSDKGGKEVDREVQEAYEEGVSGVPNFTVGGYEIPGAQEPVAFVKLFERIKSKERESKA